MSVKTKLKTTLLLLSDLLVEERECLKGVRFGDLQEINRRKSETLRRLDRTMNQEKDFAVHTDELQPYIEQVRRQARQNTQLLGSALNGAKSAADALEHIQSGEPVNRTYTSLGTQRPISTTQRKNNLLV